MQEKAIGRWSGRDGQIQLDHSIFILFSFTFFYSLSLSFVFFFIFYYIYLRELEFLLLLLTTYSVYFIHFIYIQRSCLFTT
jgi:hypothetical protein